MDDKSENDIIRDIAIAMEELERSNKELLKWKSEKDNAYKFYTMALNNINTNQKVVDSLISKLRERSHSETDWKRRVQK